VATRLLIPGFSSGGNFTEALFGDLGTTPTEIARTAVTDPHLVGEHLGRSNPRQYLIEMTGAYGFVPLLSPLALLMALPQVAINLLAAYDFFWTTKVHYAALPLFATTVAAVEGAARARRPGVRRFVLGAMAVGAFYTAVTWGLSPVSPEYRSGYWLLTADTPEQVRMQLAVSLPGSDDGVSAAYNLVPHLTHREHAYTFPNPWAPSNWGVDGENRPDPQAVDWLLVDPGDIAPGERGILARVLRDPDRALDDAEIAVAAGETKAFVPGAVVDRSKWAVVRDEPGLLALRRVRTGG
jgi:hypothetical protein